MPKNNKPYKEEILESGVIKRVFDANTDSHELTWHRDKKDRLVTVVNESDWMIQFDNDLPKKLIIGESVIIPKETYHRVIKGDSNLVVEIQEFNSLDEAKKKGKGKKDACYYKVKSRYSVWPSAYGSGSLVQCRKVGAANWGNKSEGLEEGESDVNEVSDYMTKLLTAYRNIRVVMSHEAKINFRPTPIDKQKVGSKPSGFWYGFGDSWLQWVKSEMPDWETEHIHIVKINKNRVLRISSHDELVAFTDEYGSQISGMGPNYVYIDWVRVAEKYAGIEINPYISKARRSMMWYDPWDVASGCIWGDDGIVSIELFDEYDDHENYPDVFDENTYEVYDRLSEKTDYSKEKSKGLHGWFERRGGEGSQGWVDCNTCRKDPDTGRKKCKPCGRKEGEDRAKYPSCRPTPSSCKTKGKGEKWGKKSENTVSLIKNMLKEFIETEKIDEMIGIYKYEKDERMNEPAIVEPEVKPDVERTPKRKIGDSPFTPPAKRPSTKPKASR